VSDLLINLAPGAQAPDSFRVDSQPTARSPAGHHLKAENRPSPSVASSTSEAPTRGKVIRLRSHSSPALKSRVKTNAQL